MPPQQPTSSPSPMRSISASILFSSRELKRYRQWQRQTTTLRPAEQGCLPTATEYDDFQKWLERHDSGYFSDTFEDIAMYIRSPSADSTATSTPSLPAMGTVCHHLLHPGEAAQNMPRCPVCTITAHLNYMEAIQRVLKHAGGHPPRSSRNSSSSSHQETAYQAWCRSKLDALKELSRLEHLAEKAERWTTEHAKQDIGNVKTSKEALSIYWTEITQPVHVSHTAPTHTPNIEKKKNKSVGFLEDTDFKPGRPQVYYWRRSPRYEPGKYTVAGETEDADTDSDSEEPLRTQKIQLSKENSSDRPVTNIKDEINEEANHGWQNIDCVEDESDSDDDVDDEVDDEDDEDDDSNFVVFEEDGDDEGSFIVFDD